MIINNNLRNIRIESLNLTNFRNHKSLKLNVINNIIVITGDNGVGKTNILEAISLLAPGKGIRGARNHDILHKNTVTNYSAPYWHISSDVISSEGSINIEIKSEINQNRKAIKVNSQNLRTQADLADFVSMIWLTPQMDQIFLDASADRRKFLDRIVYNFDQNHARLIINYDYFVKERMKLLKTYSKDLDWLKVVEANIADLGIKIAAARVKIINLIEQEINEQTTTFPKARIFIKGDIEDKILNMDIDQLKEEYINKLLSLRRKDLESGRTNTGIHRSDLIVFHTEKNMSANFCSTGEQKALLISIILAVARKLTKTTGYGPIVLLDEVIAHLDNFRKKALLDDIMEMNLQAWLTGTNIKVFDAIDGCAQFLTINNNVLIN